MAPPTKPRKTTAPAATTQSAPRRYTVDRLDQVRLLAHPLRLRLFEAFALEPRTTHQVARLLGLAPTRLYHHVNALEKVGLLRLTETRQVRGATEKYYQAAGRMLDIEPGLFARGAPGGARGAGRMREEIEALTGQVFESARLDLIEALARRKETPKSLRPIVARVVVYGSPAELAALRRRLARWLEKYTKKRGPTEGQTRRGAAQGASRASFTLVFSAGPRHGRSESG